MTQVRATIADVPPLLALTTDLPEVSYAPGDVVIREGTTTGAIWVLVSGGVRVLRGDQTIITADRPGLAFGEISLLLGQPHGATVEAVEPTVMRLARDGASFIDQHPAVTRTIATDLARRLDTLTIYLADVQAQYGAAPGVSMVADVLRHLAQQPTEDPGAARPVSARDPDPEF